MKKLIVLLFIAVTFAAQAQLSDYIENGRGSVKAGAAYVHDFPGLHGVAFYGEYSFPLNEWLQGGMGIKNISTSGFPRTASVNEYTKATTLDFNLLFAAYHDDKSALRIGAVYSFSFYNIRRSYPVYDTHISAPATESATWQVQDTKSRISGFGLIGEYEYYFQNSLSVGARVSLCKVYNHVLMGGPFAAIRF
jgi:hypothetical protein